MPYCIPRLAEMFSLVVSMIPPPLSPDFQSTLPIFGKVVIKGAGGSLNCASRQHLADANLRRGLPPSLVDSFSLICYSRTQLACRIAARVHAGLVILLFFLLYFSFFFFPCGVIQEKISKKVAFLFADKK